MLQPTNKHIFRWFNFNNKHNMYINLKDGGTYEAHQWIISDEYTENIRR